MISLRHIKNATLFYIKKYGIIKTIKKCIKVVLRKLNCMIHLKKDVNYGDYGDWIKTNEVKEAELKAQMDYKFDFEPKISLIVPMYQTKEKFLKELVDSVISQTYQNWELVLSDGSPTENEKYKKIIEKDKRIKYDFLNENKGISGNSNEAIRNGNR